VHNVSQWLNLRHLGEPLGGAKGLLEAASFKKVWVEEESKMPDGSEFQTAGATTTPKPHEAKIMRTQGTDNRLVLAEWLWRMCGSVVIKKGVDRLSGAESVVGQRGKFEFYALLNRKPMEIFKSTRWVSVFWTHYRPSWLIFWQLGLPRTATFIAM